jgi:hypothetical protein
LTLAGVAGQVGCLTLIIVLAAVFAGLWLDNQFNTRPVITLTLLVVSIPVSVLAMLYVVRLATSKIKTGISAQKQGRSEEDDLEGKS